MQEFITIPTEIIGELPRGKPFTNEQAYIDLIQMADENGQIITSERKLMNRWKWSNTRVRKFLEVLERQSSCKAIKKQQKSTQILIDTEFVGIGKSDKKAIKKQSESSQEEEKQGEEIKKTPKSKTFVPPTVEQVEQYCMERNNTVDAQKFVDFYTSKGWLVGKAKMKDWKASVRTWENTEKKRNQNNSRSYDGNSRDEQFQKLMEQIRRDEIDDN